MGRSVFGGSVGRNLLDLSFEMRPDHDNAMSEEIGVLDCSVKASIFPFSRTSAAPPS